MSRRTLPLLLVLAVTATALVAWLLVPSSQEGGRAEGPRKPAVARAEPSAEPEAPAPLPLEAAEAVEPSDAGAAPEREEIDLAAERRRELRADASTQWVEGRLFLPRETPADERAFVLAVDRRMGMRRLYGDDGPAVAAWNDDEECNGMVDWDVAEPDGSFRIAVPADVEVIHLAVSGRYLYSPMTQAVRLPADDVALSAELGAWITGALVPPRDAEQPALDGTEVELGPDITSGFNAFEVQDLAVTYKGVTDPEGRFEFRGVSTALGHGLVARPEALAAARMLGIDPDPGEHLELDVPLTRGATLSGRVVDAQGAPVAEARVEAGFPGPLGQAMGTLRETEADESGAFVLESVASGKLELRAMHASYRPAKLKVSEDEAREGATLGGLQLVLEEGGKITGVVRFPGGEPAADAEVSASPDMSQLTGMGAMSVDWQDRGTAKTDADGRFEIKSLGTGRFQVRAQRSIDEGARAGKWSATETNVSAGGEPLELVLQALLEVEGIVVDAAGQPVPEFSVAATLEGSGGMFGIGAERRREGFRDEAGTFRLGGLSTGTWELVVSADGYASSEPQSLELPGTDAEPARFVLRPAASIAGEVQDTSGAPVSGAKVTLHLDLAGRLAAMQSDSMPTAYSDARGQFLLTNLDPGDLQLVASLPGYAPSEALACEVVEGQLTENVVLRLRMGGILTGEILDDEGRPDAGRMVVAQKTPDFGAQQMMTSDSRGTFRAEHLEPGKWQVVAVNNFLTEGVETSDDPQSAMANMLGDMKMDIVTIVDGQETHVVLGAPPANPVTVRGHVTHDGEPVKSAIVSFLPENAEGVSAMKMDFTDETGAFEAELEHPGAYLVTAQITSDVGMQNSVEYRESIPEGEDEYRLDIELPLGRISGTVRGPDRKPLAGCRVTLTTEGGQTFGSLIGGQYTETTTDDEGVYDLNLLRPGTYTVAAGGVALGGLLGGGAPGGRQLRTGIEVEDGQHRDGVDFQLEKPGKIVGKVVDVAAKPVAGATVFVRGEDGNMLERFSFLTTDASGNFTYEGVSAGRYSVMATKDDLASRETALVRVPDGGSGTVNVVLDQGAFVLVSVTDEENEDVQARIRVVDPEGRAVEGMISLTNMMELSQNFSTKEQRIGPLAPGSYEVTATAEDGRSTKKPVTLRAGTERKLKIRLK